MIELNSHLKEDCDRWKKIIGMNLFQSSKTVSVFDILDAHYLIIDHFYQNLDGEGIGGIGPRDENMLLSAISRQNSSFGSLTKWTNDFDICATLFFGLIKNHPFHDANKRTALLTLLYHLWKLQRVPDTEYRELEHLALRVASNSLDEYAAYKSFKNKPDSEVKFIADFLRRNTRKIDRQIGMITYRELNSILKGFGCRLDNPWKNRIQIITTKETEYRDMFLRKQKYREEVKIGEIDFPGWTKEVGKSVLTKARKLTKLTPEDGIDSEVFFRDARPLGALIDRYKGPLQRLANK